MRLRTPDHRHAWPRRPSSKQMVRGSDRRPSSYIWAALCTKALTSRAKPTDGPVSCGHATNGSPPSCMIWPSPPLCPTVRMLKAEVIKGNAMIYEVCDVDAHRETLRQAPNGATIESSCESLASSANRVPTTPPSRTRRPSRRHDARASKRPSVSGRFPVGGGVAKGRTITQSGNVRDKNRRGGPETRRIIEDVA